MPTFLQQQTDAGFPLTPGAAGLSATLSDGHGGAYVSVPIDPGEVLHTRVMFAPRDAHTGRAHLAGGWSDGGDACWSLAWEPDTRAVSLLVPSESPITATLPEALAWHHLEVGLDADAGTATLRINGLHIGALSGAAITPTARAWLGVLAKSRGMAGTLALDQWVLADAPIGPPRISPTREDAADPARWLVVYNAGHPDAAHWADHYRQQRAVPYANLCGLTLPLTETIDAPGYLALRDAVGAYLEDNALTGSVVGVLLGLGVPGVVDMAGDGDQVAVSSLLHTDSAGDAATVNPLHRDPLEDRPTAEALGGVRFTGRIDAPTLAQAIALTERATDLMDDPPQAASGGTLWLDPAPEDAGVNPLFTAPPLAWAQGEGPGTLRVPVELANGGAFTAVQDDLAFWGWGQPAPPPGFFGDAPGRRAVCVQLAQADPPADSVRDTEAGHWARHAVDAGYASVAASTRAYSLSALPQPGVFFEALRRGWTLAEAWCVCQPFLRSGMQMLGDPLLRIAFPKSGFNLYGPVSDLQAIDPVQPTLRLPANAEDVALPASHRPAPGEPARYMVRRIDASGRSDGASASLYAQAVNGRVVTPPPMPAWPGDAGWHAAVVDGQVRAAAVWPIAPRGRGAGRVVLEAEIDGAPVEPVWEGQPGVGEARLSVSAPLPTGAQRVRWRVVGEAGNTTAGPWSASLNDTPAVESDLHVYEVKP